MAHYLLRHKRTSLHYQSKGFALRVIFSQYYCFSDGYMPSWIKNLFWLGFPRNCLRFRFNWYIYLICPVMLVYLIGSLTFTTHDMWCGAFITSDRPPIGSQLRLGIDQSPWGYLPSYDRLLFEISWFYCKEIHFVLFSCVMTLMQHT